MEDDQEERLSFSDLQFLSNDLQMESKGLSFDENINHVSSLFNQDFLGFFIDGNQNPNASEHIIFCGKVIDVKSGYTQNPNHKNKANCKKYNKNDIPIWKSEANGEKIDLPNSKSKKLLASRRKGDNYDKKERTLKLPSKSRWHIFMFGSGRFPIKMEKSDIIRRKQQQWSHRVEEEKICGKRFSGLIRVLICSDGFDDKEMIKGSAGYLNPF